MNTIIITKMIDPGLTTGVFYGGAAPRPAKLSVFWQFESLDGDLEGSFPINHRKIRL
jgi:hypothetical protein